MKANSALCAMFSISTLGIIIIGPFISDESWAFWQCRPFKSYWLAIIGVAIINAIIAIGGAIDEMKE